jgi:hypothetical protein
VDGHVSEARRRLGARDRREAALMVAAWEAAETPLNVKGGQSRGLPEPWVEALSFEASEDTTHARQDGHSTTDGAPHGALRQPATWVHADLLLGGAGRGPGLDRGQPAPAGHDAGPGLGHPQAGGLHAPFAGLAGGALPGLGIADETFTESPDPR